MGCRQRGNRRRSGSQPMAGPHASRAVEHGVTARHPNRCGMHACCAQGEQRTRRHTMICRKFGWFFACTALASAALAAEAGSEVMEALDKHLAAARAFEDGQDGNPLLEIERVVFAMPPDAKLRDAVEQKLIDALQSASTDAGKRFLCTQLRVVGTAKCVPALEQRLLEDSVSHMAVYALGNLESLAACEALHRAMLKTGQLAQVGIINALADRGYEKAGPDIAALIASEDVRVASAAVRALGRLGGADAVKRLQAARDSASPALAADIDNSLLDCAERFLSGGKATEAADIYALLEQSARDPQLKLAALRGLLLSREDQAAGQLVQSIQAADAELACGAISFLNLVPGQEMTKAVVRLLPSLPDARQVLLLRALGERRDVTASPAIVAALGSGDTEVRVAALEALAGAGDASALPALLQAAAADGPGQPVARASLVLLNAAEIDRELLRLVDAGESAGRVEAIRALAGRGVADAVVPLLKLARTDNASIRRAALETLGKLAGEAHLEPLLQLAIEPIDAADQPV
ncbi:MAG: hypothetical protein FJ276_14310, partial [Planctomycetes bacterium]|nr:hypothetical protein [Planctomycetota bacterium]